MYPRYRFSPSRRVRLVTARHGTSRRGRCPTMRYVVHGPSRSTSRPRSLFNRSLYGALNTGNFSLMPAIRSIESPCAPTFPSFSERTLRRIIAVISAHLDWPLDAGVNRCSTCFALKYVLETPPVSFQMKSTRVDIRNDVTYTRM